MTLSPGSPSLLDRTATPMKACYSCRKRKVKCIYDLDSSERCVHCSYGNVECVVPPPSAGAPRWVWVNRTTKQYNQRTQGGLPSSEPCGTVVPRSGSQNAPATECIDYMPQLVSTDQPPQDPADVMSSDIDPTTLNIDGHDVLLEDLLFGEGGPAMRGRNRRSPSAGPRKPLPAYLRQPAGWISKDDDEYLNACGAFSVPQGQLQAALVSTYIEFVHGTMPLLNLPDLLLSIETNGVEGTPCSLMLYQAIMFVGAGFLDDDHVESAGFASKEEMQKAYYRKTKALFDLDYEPDQMCRVQTCLLLSHWWESLDGQKDNRYWLGVAISDAQRLGLHVYWQNTDIPLDQRRIAKRIWYCCFIRDQILALGTHQRTWIQPDDMNHPVLEMDDFDLQVSSQGICVSHVLDHHQQVQLALVFMEMVKLCHWISVVLRSQYGDVPVNLGGVPSSHEILTKLMQAPKKHTEPKSVAHCEEGLSGWFRSLPATLQDPFRSRDKALVVSTSYLHLLYFVILAALHRSELVRFGWGTRRDLSRFQSSSEIHLHAADSIKSMVEKLDTLALLRYIPTARITILATATASYFHELGRTPSRPRSTSYTRAVRGFFTCARLLHTGRDKWDSLVRTFLHTLLAQARATIPVEDWPDDVWSWLLLPRVVDGDPGGGNKGIADTSMAAGSFHSSSSIDRGSMVMYPAASGGGVGGLSIPLASLDFDPGLDGLIG
ncbi:fungal-specific transcription factor domain-containing protein [Aspergillus carlsbadensis]|nr:fungal-specific transcription factor domain-containing protein [Aspergillus carlsbadensis]